MRWKCRKNFWQKYTIQCAIDLSFPAVDSFSRTAEAIDFLGE